MNIPKWPVMPHSAQDELMHPCHVCDVPMGLHALSLIENVNRGTLEQIDKLPRDAPLRVMLSKFDKEGDPDDKRASKRLSMCHSVGSVTPYHTSRLLTGTAIVALTMYVLDVTTSSELFLPGVPRDYIYHTDALRIMIPGFTYHNTYRKVGATATSQETWEGRVEFLEDEDTL